MPEVISQEGPASLSSPFQTSDKTTAPTYSTIAERGEEAAPEAGSRESKSESSSHRLVSSVTGVLVKKHLDKRKREIVDRYMEIVNQWLEPKIVALERSHQDSEGAAGGRGRGRGAASAAAKSVRAARRKLCEGVGVGAGAGASVKRVIGQKRQLSDDEQDGGGGGDDGDDGDGQAPRDKDRTVKRTRTDEGDLRLACPYFQRNPFRFKDSLTCRGHSWPTISRLKEHLQRTHKRPTFECKRCRCLFFDESSLEEHQTQEIPCKLDRSSSRSRRDPLDGYDADQGQQLKTRLVGKSITEKWEHLYRILFFLNESDDTTKIPSPFYTPIDPCGESTDTESLDRFRQLVPMIQSTIAVHLDRELSNLLSNRHTICAITSKINDAVTSTIRTFSEIPPLPPLPPPPSAAPTTVEAEARQGPTTTEMWECLDIDGLMAQINSNTNMVLGGLIDAGSGAMANLTPYIGETAWPLDVTTEESEGFSDMFSGAGSLISVSTNTSVDASVRHLSPDLGPSAVDKGKKPMGAGYPVTA